MPVITTVALLLGCAHGPGVVPHPADATPPIGLTSPTTPGLVLPPSARILGVLGSDFGIGGVSIIEAFQSDLGLLVVSNNNGELVGLPLTVLLPGDIPRGDSDMLNLWDGVSSLDYETTVVPAGDANGDGHLDAWLWNELRHGPFLGEALRSGQNVQAWLDNTGPAYVGDVDVDGDGVNDVIASNMEQTAWVYYGPFSGRIAGAWEPDASPEITRYGDFTCPDSEGVAVLRDNLGPGRDVIAVGTEGGCGFDSLVWPLDQPRGAQVDLHDCLATSAMGGSSALPFQDLGDLDGDGFGESLFGYYLYSRILAGPIHRGTVNTSPEAFTQVNGYVTRPIGDLNGDGLTELLGARIRAFDPWDASWVLVFSPYADPIDLADGLDLGPTDDYLNFFGEAVGDLDGDGLPELVSTSKWNGWDDPPPPPEYLGDTLLRIWFGSDLRAAHEASLTTPSSP